MASQVSISTNLSGSVSGLTWMLFENIQGKKPSILGFTSGLVCGLVAITPACGFVPAWSSLIIGFGAGFFSYFFCNYKNRTILINIDDSLDVFGCHGISGIWGGIATGLFS